MCQAIRNRADLQFRRKSQMAAAVSLSVYITCSQASLRMHGTPTGVALAGLAGAGFFAELISVGLLITRLRDEFERTLLARSFIWATIITMAFTTIWGFIELHARGSVPHLDIIWIPMILVCATAGAKLFIFRQYRPEND